MMRKVLRIELLSVQRRAVFKLLSYKVRLAFASRWLKIWRENFKPITSAAITFDSHLKTSLQRRLLEFQQPSQISKSDSPLCSSDFQRSKKATEIQAAAEIITCIEAISWAGHKPGTIAAIPKKQKSYTVTTVNLCSCFAGYDIEMFNCTQCVPLNLKKIVGKFNRTILIMKNC